MSNLDYRPNNNFLTICSILQFIDNQLVVSDVNLIQKILRE